MIGENHSEPHGNLVKEWYLWTIGDGVRFERISKKEVTRARILVPHSNKNQLKPIYSVCSQLLKQIFA